MENGRDDPPRLNFAVEGESLTEQAIQIATERLESPDENVRAVAKAVLDVEHETNKIREDEAAGGVVDVSPLFDFWLGDAIASAKVLQSSEDEQLRGLANCLVEQEKAIIRSKGAFLLELKRFRNQAGD